MNKPANDDDAPAGQRQDQQHQPQTGHTKGGHNDVAVESSDQGKGREANRDVNSNRDLKSGDPKK